MAQLPWRTAHRSVARGAGSENANYVLRWARISKSSDGYDARAGNDHYRILRSLIPREAPPVGAATGTATAAARAPQGSQQRGTGVRPGAPHPLAAATTPGGMFTATVAQRQAATATAAQAQQAARQATLDQFKGRQGSGFTPL